LGFKARGKERDVGKRIRAVSEGGAERQDKRRLRVLKSPGTRRQVLKARERGEEGGLRKRRRHGEEAGLTKTRRASGRKPRSMSTTAKEASANPAAGPREGICEHDHIRSRFKTCGGSSICEHNLQRSQCKVGVRLFIGTQNRLVALHSALI
jgi:hypothetical protein